MSDLFTAANERQATPPPTTITEEEKIRQRKERLEAWKRKRAEEEEAKKKASPAALISSLERQPVSGTVPSIVGSEVAVGQTPKSVVGIVPPSSASTSSSAAARPKADKSLSAPIKPSLGTYAC